MKKLLFMPVLFLAVNCFGSQRAPVTNGTPFTLVKLDCPTVDFGEDPEHLAIRRASVRDAIVKAYRSEMQTKYAIAKGKWLPDYPYLLRNIITLHSFTRTPGDPCCATGVFYWEVLSCDGWFTRELVLREFTRPS